MAGPWLGRARRLDETVTRVRPDAWRGVMPKERVIMQALFDIVGDEDEEERLFAIIKAQSEY